MFGPNGVVSSLIGTLVIVLHGDRAELHLISASQVQSHAYRGLSAIICRSLYQDSSEEDCSSAVVVCAPAVVVPTAFEKMDLGPRVQ